LKLALERCSPSSSDRKAVAASVIDRAAALGALLRATGASRQPASTVTAKLVERAMRSS
jgi:hypothetical protein